MDATNTDADAASFTVVDVETTGLRATEHRVLSVAALTLDAAGRVVGEFHTLLDPGCDPGPVHIHGLTREVLRGAPVFDQVRDQLSELLADRIMVAHNAEFDYGFLAREFDLSGGALPVRRRLCTLALARRVSPPTPDCKLGTLATYYGVPQARAHDALDDARVLVGVLGGLTADAARLGITLPTLRCAPDERPRNRWPVERRGPKSPCRYDYPGRYEPGGRLTQGMKVAFTGETVAEREDLVARAESAGLDVTGAVSGLTSVLVCNQPDSASTKWQRARDHGTPVVTETTFLTLLADIQPGRPKTDQRRRAARPSRTRSTGPAEGPLVGRRVLVLGGSHPDAASARARIAELGGAVAVNMSASVTDVLALDGADSDRRLAIAVELGLPVHGMELLGSVADVAQVVDVVPVVDVAPPVGLTPVVDLAPVVSESAAASVLVRGQVIDLPVAEHGGVWTVRASWRQDCVRTADVIAFLLDGDEKVTGDADFVFYNQPETAGAGLSVEGPSEQSVALSLDRLPEHCRRVVIAAALDGDDTTFGEVGAIEIEIAPGGACAPVIRATLDAATDERTLLLTEIYLRGDAWRVRAVGQGYPTGLAELARGYGVDVAG
ncbi:exonuclease domain-containing protein [Nocardia bovistercoris]|uniref:exonuclease domain-containing protein n=1 Tax=Nocardia bovistercoris TaxID=2785916 RepID=UPI002FCCC9A9